ncbi:hypothetical protein B0O99DRAFT_590405 [Bisporella sp. PMI_857]|nr:hypothetical protein B0O99DRAFT_590405 [Bisporella sp. PMI_857]
MASRSFFLALLAFFILNIASTYAQTPTVTDTSAEPTSTVGETTPAPTLSPSSTRSSTTRTTNGTTSTISGGTGVLNGSEPPDVYLHVPELSVGRIELNVDNLKADINLNAAVAGLVNINAGVAVSIEKVNLTIVDVGAELELTVRLGNLVAIVERVFNSLDLNPLLLTALQEVGDLLDAVVGVVDGLLGSITQGGTTLNFLIDNLGNIVQQVVGGATGTVSTIVGDYLTNMTATGAIKDLGSGFTQKTYLYSPLNALVNIITNSLGQVVQAVVVKDGGGSGTTTSSSATATATVSSTVAARR